MEPVDCEEEVEEVEGDKEPSLEEILSNPEMLKSVCEAAFKDSDKDGSGYLDRSEFRTVCEEINKDISE